MKMRAKIETKPVDLLALIEASFGLSRRHWSYRAGFGPVRRRRVRQRARGTIALR